MRVVVTGASGFLGRALLRALDRPGIEVVGLSRRPCAGLLQVPGYGDAPRGDVLVHLAEMNDRRAAAAAGAAYEQDALATLRALLGKGYARVVYASSCVLYGDRSAEPHGTEDAVQVSDVYTRLKYASECEVLAHGGTVARFANLYGPGMSSGNVLATIVGQLGTSGPLRVLDTTPVRDFLWIGDAAEALARMCEAEAKGIFNVGSGAGTSILQLARTVLAAAGQAQREVEAAAPGDGTSRLVLDIRRTQAALGWRPGKSLPAGIRSLLQSLGGPQRT